MFCDVIAKKHSYQICTISTNNLNGISRLGLILFTTFHASVLKIETQQLLSKSLLFCDNPTYWFCVMSAPIHSVVEITYALCFAIHSHSCCNQKHECVNFKGF